MSMSIYLSICLSFHLSFLHIYDKYIYIYDMDPGCLVLAPAPLLLPRTCFTFGRCSPSRISRDSVCFMEFTGLKPSKPSRLTPTRTMVSGSDVPFTLNHRNHDDESYMNKGVSGWRQLLGYILW